MDKKYEIPECEEIKMQVENNIMTSGDASGEVPEISRGTEE